MIGNTRSGYREKVYQVHQPNAGVDLISDTRLVYDAVRQNAQTYSENGVGVREMITC